MTPRSIWLYMARICAIGSFFRGQRATVDGSKFAPAFQLTLIKKAHSRQAKHHQRGGAVFGRDLI